MLVMSNTVEFRFIGGCLWISEYHGEIIMHGTSQKYFSKIY